jgi:molybdopterin-guanine dinucleotide biosynthesis protein B
VATVKHTSHGHQFDTPGKDSFRHRQAGADMTLAVGSDQIALFADTDSDTIDAIVALMSERFDICLVEGDKRSERPCVFLARNADEFDHSAVKKPIAVYGESKLHASIPHFLAGAEANLASLIETHAGAAIEESHSAV